MCSRAIRGHLLYLDDSDRQFFLLLFERICERLGWTCHSYCLMSNHYHLLIEVREDTLALGLQRLNGVYARWFNDAHGFTKQGHVFKERYFSELIEGEGHFLATARYIVLNPVRAGICRDAGDWRWSSHRAIASSDPRPGLLRATLLLRLFSPNADRARELYREFVSGRRALTPPLAGKDTSGARHRPWPFRPGRG